MHSSTRKPPQKITQKYNSAIYNNIGQLKNVRVLAPPMLFGIEPWRQWQPLKFTPIQASNEALRSIQHERRNVVILVAAK